MKGAEQYDKPAGGIKMEDLDEYETPEWEEWSVKINLEQMVIDQMTVGLKVTTITHNSALPCDVWMLADRISSPFMTGGARRKGTSHRE
jgi:hypothetical protein